MPPQKRACLTTPAPGYEIGESSAAGVARQPGPTPEVYTLIELSRPDGDSTGPPWKGRHMLRTLEHRLPRCLLRPHHYQDSDDTLALCDDGTDATQRLENPEPQDGPSLRLGRQH
ncbi:hypothetical protein Tco_1328890 [Tanacetum coccineum]